MRRLLFAGMMGLGGWVGPATCVHAQEAPQPPAAKGEDTSQRLITMDFQDVDISVLVKFISELTGRNFIVDDKVRGKVTIISPGKISVDEAYAVFQSVLQVKGFTTVPAGSIIKIVPTKEAKTSTLQTVLPNISPPPRDEYVTRLVPLKFVDANAIAPVLQPLVSPDGMVTAYPATNTLILIDTAAQTDRVVSILRQLDVEGFQQGIEVVRLNYAFATEIASLLQQVLEEPEEGAQAGAPATRPGAAPDARLRRGARATRSTGAAATAATVTGGVTPERSYRIIPDERTNSLILLAGPVEMRRIKELITRLDVPLPLGTGRVHVYYLKYANALEMVSVLSFLVGGGGGGGLGGVGLAGARTALGGMAGVLRGGSSALGGRGAGGYGGGFGGYGGGGYGGYGGYGSYGGGGYGGYGGYGGAYGQAGYGGATGSLATRGTLANRGGVGTTGAPGAPGTQQSEFEGVVRLSADPATNALIINASPQDFETLREVIEKLDVRRRQVYVEAIIAEVSVDKTRELGIEFQGVADFNNGVGVARTNLSGDINQLLQPTSLSGLLLAAASSQTITVGGVTIPAQQFILRALERDAEANILSAPAVLTSDNQQAEIVSGQNVPFIASRATSDVNLSNTFATIERRDVGITLRIIPQISEGGMVRLDIFEEVSDVVSNDPQLGPTTTIRSATTTTVARDGQTVVIGGLIFDGATKDQSKVPFLGDVPVLGAFFRFNSVRNRKTNLLIFLTPHIIRNEREHSDLSVEERQRIMFRPFEEQGRRPPNWEALYRPSWEVRPSIEPESSAQKHVGEGMVREYGRATDGTTAAVSDRYVLLAAIWEAGPPPPSLTSSNGMVALAVPPSSPLAPLFVKGGGYRFEAEGYAADYVCLEVFHSPQEAFAVYPEGLQVSAEPLSVLSWREPTEASTGAVANWAASN